MNDVEFLKDHWHHLKKDYRALLNLSPEDVHYDRDAFPETSEADNRIAVLADKHGLPGDAFRNLRIPHEEDSFEYSHQLSKMHSQLEILPRLVAKVEAEKHAPPPPEKRKLSKLFAEAGLKPPNESQLQVWHAMDGRAVQVADFDCSRSTLYETVNIKFWREQGWVGHLKGRGFYRPDAPPPDFEPD